MLAMLLGFGAMVACAGWYYFGRGKSEASELEPSQLTATAVANNPSLDLTATYTQQPTDTPTIMATAMVTYTPILSPTISPTISPIRSVKSSPLAHQPVVMPLSPVPTPTPSPTPRLFDYEMIGYEVEREGLYSYVSGWIVEADGATPRPVAVRLSYPTGEMRYPRPNNTDVANGRYEFLVSPGQYWLSIDDPGSPQVPVTIGDRSERHEISFRLLIERPLNQPARSSPWSGSDPATSNHNPSKPKPKAPPPAPNSQVFLPLVTKPPIVLDKAIFLPIVTRQGERRYYLPLVSK